MGYDEAQYLNKAKQFYTTHLSMSQGIPSGATCDEINIVESQFGVKFPLAYREFLVWMGKDYYGIFKGSDTFIDHVLSNSESLSELLADNNICFEHKSKPLVFSMHGGYVANWFYPEENVENPLVYNFSEGSDELPRCTNKPFSKYILEYCNWSKTLLE